MASKGTYSAYQQLSPIRADFGDPMERFADRIIATQDKQRAEEERRRAERLQQSRYLDQEMKELDPVITGIRSVDEINYRAYADAAQQLGDIHRQILNNPDAAMDPNLRMRRMNLLKSPQIQAAFQQQLTKQYQALTEGIANGKISKWEMDAMDQMSAYYGVEQEDGTISPNFVLKHNDRGEMYAVVKTPKGDMVRHDVNAVINGYKFGSFVQRLDKDKYLKDLSDRLGKNQSIRNRYGGTVVESSFNREGAMDMLRTALVDDSGRPTDMAKSMWVDHMGGTPQTLDQKALQEIQDSMMNELEMSFDKTTSNVSYRPGTGSGVDRSGTPTKYHSVNRLNPVENQQGGMLLENGDAVLNYTGGAKIDDSPNTWFGVAMKPNGDLYLKGQRKTKVKGVDGSMDKEEVSEATGIDIEKLLFDENTVTYYKIDPDVEEDPRKVALFANTIGLGGIGQLR